MRARLRLRDSKARITYNKTEIFQKLVKILYIFQQALFLKLLTFEFFLYCSAKSIFKTRIKNFCVVSGRGRGIVRQFKVSRINLRVLGNAGIFFGLRKVSW